MDFRLFSGFQWSDLPFLPLDFVEAIKAAFNTIQPLDNFLHLGVELPSHTLNVLPQVYPHGGDLCVQPGLHRVERRE
jgi:hypothetical protein